MYTKQEFIQKIRAKYPVYDGMSDDKLYDAVITKYPEYEKNIIAEESTPLYKEVGQGVVDFGGAVVKGLDNLSADITNNTIGRITGIEYKPAREYIAPSGEEYKGGLLQRSIDTIAEKGQMGADALAYSVEGQKEGGLSGAKKQAIGTYQGAGAVVGGVVDIFGDTVMSGIKTIAPDKIEEKVKAEVQDKMNNTRIGNEVMDLMNEYQSNMDFLKENDPDAYRTHQANFSYISGLAELTGMRKIQGVYKSGGQIKNIPVAKIKEINQDIINKAREEIVKVAEVMGTSKNKTFGKVGEILDSLPKPSKEYQKAITTQGTEFEVDVTPSFLDNVNDVVFRKNNQEMAVQSVFPKQTKEKGLNARLNAGKTALGSIEQLYDDFAKGIVKADIHTMGGGVEGVEQALEYWGKKIGQYTDVDTTMSFRKEIDTLAKSMDENFAKLNPDMYNRVKKVVDVFNEVGDEVSIKDMQKAISNIKSDVFSNFEITKQLSSSSTGKALNNLLENLQEKFDATIDIATGGSKQLKEAKTNYSKYKKIQKDLTDSFIVAQRNAGKGLSGTAGKLGGAYEVLSNPSLGGIIKGVILKQSGELISKAKSRDGNWEMLIRNLDRKAVKNYSVKPKYDPKTENLANNPTTYRNRNSVSDTMSDTDSRVDNGELLATQDEIVEFVSDLKGQIEANIGNKEALLELREALDDFPEIPDRYTDILSDKLDNYIRDIERYEAEVNIMGSASIDDMYGSELTKAFNGLQGIEKRVKTSKFDKHNQVEFQKSPAYKKFSDSAQEYIGERDLDLSVQELYDQMKDFDSGVKFQKKAENPMIQEKQELIDEINEYGEAWDSDDNYFDVDDIDRLQSDIKSLKRNGRIEENNIKELETLKQEAKKYNSIDDFLNDYQSDSLLDISDPAKQRFGRLLEDGVDEDSGKYMNTSWVLENYGDQLGYYKDSGVPRVSSPDDVVTIYRGTSKKQEDMLPGDFVTFSKEYAESHNDAIKGGAGKLIELEVPAKDVVWQGNDFNEWIYSPENLRGADYDGGLKKIFSDSKDVEKFQNQTTGKGERISPEEATKVVRKYFSEKDLDVEVVDRITTPDGMEAFGKYRDQMITFSKNPIDSTPEHEVLHAYFDMVIPENRQAKILAEVKKGQNIKDDLNAEEWLADTFVEFVRGREVSGISESLKKALSDLVYRFKTIFAEGDKVEKLYRDLEALSIPKSSISKTKAGVVAGIEQNTGEEAGEDD